MRKQKSGESNLQREGNSTKNICIKQSLLFYDFYDLYQKTFEARCWEGEESAAIARDGRHLWLGKQASGSEAWS